MTTKEQIQAILSQEGAVNEIYQIIHELETKVAYLEQELENATEELRKM